MNLPQIFAGVDWLAVLAATIAAFLLGAVWYSRSVFGNAWMQEVGLTDEAVESANLPLTFAATFLLQAVASVALSAFLGDGSGWLDGLLTGLWVGVFWVATAYGVTYLFEQRSVRLWLINAGYYVALFAIMGTVVGALD
jgi:hypothetical protein